MDFKLSYTAFVEKYVTSRDEYLKLMPKWYRGNPDREKIYSLEADALELNFEEFYKKNSSRYGDMHTAEQDYEEIRNLPFN